MVYIIFALGCLAMGLCLASLIRPRFLRRIIDFFSVGSRLYLAGLIRIICAVILLILSAQARFWGYVIVIGIIAAASGLSIFFFALRRTKKILARLRNQSDLVLRLFALTGLAIWVMLLYCLLPLAVSFPR